MTRDEVAGQLEAWVRTQFKVTPEDARFTHRAPLFELGYVDSVGVVELFAFIRDRFGVEIPDEVAIGDEFTTLDGMAGAITRLRAAQP